MKEFLKKNWEKVLLVMVAIIVVAAPFITQHFIIGSDYPSKGSNDGWLSFFGSYLGGVIGGVISGAVTLCVLLKTLKSNDDTLEVTLAESRRQYEENKALQIMPRLIISIYEEGIEDVTYPIIYAEPKATHQKNENLVDTDPVIICFENIGLGPANDFNVVIIDGFGGEIQMSNMEFKIRGDANLIGKDGKVLFFMEYKIEEDYLEGEPEYVQLEARFKDILDNVYKQTFVIGIKFMENPNNGSEIYIYSLGPIRALGK